MAGSLGEMWQGISLLDSLDKKQQSPNTALHTKGLPMKLCHPRSCRHRTSNGTQTTIGLTVYDWEWTGGGRRGKSD